MSMFVMSLWEFVCEHEGGEGQRAEADKGDL
jgi:hypothetical protein